MPGATLMMEKKEKEGKEEKGEKKGGEEKKKKNILNLLRIQMIWGGSLLPN